MVRSFGRVAAGVAMVWACASVWAGDLEVAARSAGNFYLFDGDKLVLTTEGLVFGPKYQWRGGRIESIAELDGTTVLTSTFAMPGAQNPLRYATSVKKADHSMEWALGNSAAADYPLTYTALTMQAQDPGAKLVIVPVGGEPVLLSSPLRISTADAVKGLKWEIGGRSYEFTIDPPQQVVTDGNARIILARDTAVGGKQYQAKVTLQGDAVFHKTLDSLRPSVDTSSWFAFTPANDNAAGAIGMQDWLTLPQNPLKLEGDRIIKDGQAVRLWGTNVEYVANCPPKPDAAKAAAFFAKQGINAVRMHKLTNPGWEGMGSGKGAGTFDQEKLDRFDYLVSQLRQQKVMYGLSPIWDLTISPADRDKLVAYDELVAAGGDKPTTVGFVWFAKDVQDLHIQTMLNLLNRTNPYTKLSYLQDPAVAYIEMQNEECVFFYTTMPRVLKAPTYAKMVAGQFSDWLLQKYGSHEGLVKAWGQGALNSFGECLPNENLAQRNIFPVGNPWMWDNIKDGDGRRQRLVDTAAFLFAKQDEYYKRMEAALRSAGYQGPLVASNWQAGGDLGHFYNLLSDARIGIIDRHNYMGGPGSWDIGDGRTFSNDTSLGDPGAALLSTGLQQVASRPFSISEWLAVHPQETTAAETVIMAAYGMGLQGWDMSYYFSSNAPGYTRSLFENNTKVFNNQTPINVGLFPVLSRMVLRGDVKEAEVLSRRTISMAQLESGKLPFVQGTTQNGDLKSFSGEPHHSIMAVGRAVVDLVDSPEPMAKFDPAKYREGSTLVSTTKQLRWTVDDKHLGWISIDTAGTQGIAGYAPVQELRFADLSLTPQTPYAVVLATAAHPDRKLADDNNILVVAVARAQNTGMAIRGNLVIKKGDGPILVEPVRAKLSLKRAGTPTVYVLDHDGQRTDKTLPVTNGSVEIDTGRDKAIYYEIVYP